MILPGYEILDEVHRNRRRILWRVRRERDALPFLIKAPVEEFPEPHQLSALRREFQVLSQLEIPGIIRPVELLSWRDRLALVLEDAGETTLKHRIAEGPIAISEVVQTGIEIATMLCALHRRGIVHKDMTSHSIVVRRGTGRITLSEFGIASRLPSEMQRPGHPQSLEGTTAYLSPEQTGRMNRELDHRTDFYSLGVTLYEMLTGRLPFDSADPLEIIHGHIARTPTAPVALRPEVPDGLNRLVLKLLAKAPEERYQGARGIVRDLDRLAKGDPIAALGSDDIPERFFVSARLYGREEETARLRAAFERTAEGSSELALLSGFSGIGKTSLIQQLYAALPRTSARLITGKFDQLARDVPYRAISQAFRGLVVQLLAEPDASVQATSARLCEVLGRNGQVMIDLVPELERLIGPQPPAPPLGGAEAQARFNRLFQDLVRAVASPAQPLVIFLDDLQWADAGTLSLLLQLLECDAIPGLLVIGAYRDNEVSPTHSLRLTLTDLAARGTRITEVRLAPLDPAQVGQLVADSLRVSETRARALAEVVHRKTGGNPFFVKQLLHSLWQDGVIAFDEELGSWSVDLARAADAPATDNVLELMTSRLTRLEPAAQRALRLAACIGNRFELRTLAITCEESPSAVVEHLAPAVDAGLVIAPERTYGFAPDLGGDPSGAALVFRFLHDRVQQAAFALIPPAERAQVHLTIGRRLLAEQDARGEAEIDFEIVNHLNHGRELLHDPAELRRLAELNLAAGRRAKASAAYPSALGFFSAGVTLLPALSDGPDELSFALWLEQGEAEYLTGRMQEAESTLLQLLERSRTPIERADVVSLLVTQYETLSRYDDAIAIGLDGLRRLGVNLDDDPLRWEADLQAEVRQIRGLIGSRAIAELVELPVLEDPAMRQVLRLLQGCWTPSYVSGKSRLGDLLVARLVRLSLEHGNCAASAFGYLHHAITVGSHLGEYRRGAELGELALAVNARFNDQRLRAVVFHRFAALVAPWRHPFARCVEYAREAERAATESGNLPVAGYSGFQQAWYAMQLDPDLASFTVQHTPTVALLDRLQIHSYAEMQRIMLQWAAALRGETAWPTTLDGNGYDDARYRATVGHGGIFRALHATVQLELLYTAGQFDDALRYAETEEAAAEVFVGSIWPAIFAFRYGLTLAATGASPERLAAIEGRFAQWAASAPENFRHMLLLLQAERARLEHRAGDAVTAYEAALDATAGLTSPRHRALVNERYGEFWLARGQPRVAQAFLAEARYGYDQWGATTKVRQLDERIGMLGLEESSRTGEAAGPLDLAGVMKAAQAIAREMQPDRLLERMMAIALEVAGADHGVLLLEADSQAVVRVIASPAGSELLPHPGHPLHQSHAPVGLVQLVRRNREAVVIGNAAEDERTAHDAYVLRQRPRALLCAPVLNQGALIGVLYVENRHTTEAFTTERVHVLQLLSAQAAIALHNAHLYDALRASLEEVGRLKDRLQTENIYLQEQINHEHGFEEIVGRSDVLRRVLGAVEQVAPVDTTVLISGETGTGKELLARAIHRLSPRHDHPLVTVNCGAVAPGLVESELFGHEKGAFTGALSRRLGRFEVADGGTLFLDEIGDLPLDLQVKLLRVLQEGEFERVGGGKPIRVNVRVIAATHRDLEALVREGKFRADLFYRLNVFPIRSPALRERPEDIPELVRYFVLKYATKLGKRVETIPRDALERLTAYEWAGNIRELANIIERSVILTRGTALELEGPLGSAPLARASIGRSGDGERRRILEVLEQTGWRVSGPKGAALLLGLKPTTLEARMKRLGLKRPGMAPT